MRTQQEIMDLLVGMLGRESFLELAEYVETFLVYEDMDAFVQAITDKADSLKPIQEEETLDFVEEDLGDGVVRFNLTPPDSVV